MEIERKHTFFHSFDTVVDTTLFREETLEAIVPDACPDMLEIIETVGIVVLTDKSAKDGQGEMTGEIRASVLYRSDADEAVRHMDVTLPFHCTVEHNAMTSESKLMAKPSLRRIDARALNPRKVLIRAEVAVAVSVRLPKETQMLCEIACEEKAGLQQKIEQVRHFMTVCVEEKAFSLSDTIRLPAGTCEELLSARAVPVCSEAKIIGTKLICKGDVRTEILYRSAGQVELVKYELPFSQILEVSNAGEDSIVTLLPVLKELSCTPENGGDDLSVSLTVLAQAVVEEERTFTVIRDLYSTAFEVTAMAETLRLRQMVENAELPVTIRETVETPTAARRVIDCSVELGQVTMTEEGNQTTLTAPGMAYVLYQDESDQLHQAAGAFMASCPLDAQNGALISSICLLDAESYATPTAGGVEARISLRFHAVMCTERQLAVVGDMTIDAEHPRASEGEPSLILRPLQPGEQLWDIAKHYHTTVEELMRANELTDSEVLGGKMLLIPRQR